MSLGLIYDESLNIANVPGEKQYKLHLSSYKPGQVQRAPEMFHKSLCIAYIPSKLVQSTNKWVTYQSFLILLSVDVYYKSKGNRFDISMYN